MHPDPKRILPIIVVLFLLGGGYYLWSNGLLPGSVSTANDENLVSGFIEGDEYKVASELAGRVNAINVTEGDRVMQGQTLIELDHALLDAQIAQTQAALITAQAQLKLVANSARTSDVAAAEAALKAAQENSAKVRGGATASPLTGVRSSSTTTGESADS